MLSVFRPAAETKYVKFKYLVNTNIFSLFFL